MTSEKNCFVIMPFLPELHYFYLYIKAHIQKEHNINCARADEKVLTVPLLEKISASIQKADVIIADCSERNPNVFYELGMAHTHGKKVILITKDPIEDAPSDIKHYEFIRYDLSVSPVDFLSKLDNAFQNIFVTEYEELFCKAKEIFDAFKDSTGVMVTSNSKMDFCSLVTKAEVTGSIPSLDEGKKLKEFLLPKIIKESLEVQVMVKITDWLSTQ